MVLRNNIPKLVIKLDGTEERFRRNKIKNSLIRVLNHIGKHDRNIVNVLTDKVCHKLNKFKRIKLNVDEIRVTIRKVLKEHKLNEAAQYYELVFLHIKNIKIKKVIKRTGRIEKFEPHKIFKSIRKSFIQIGLEDGKKCEKLTKEVIKLLEKKYKNKPVPVENIKDDIEYILIKNKLPQVAKSYILYRYM